jgi:Fe2+ or Zn2+ uptake regulation protein
MHIYANAGDCTMEYRLTSARQAILDELGDADTHLTAIQIHERLVPRLPSLNLSTVYRSMDYLVDKMLVTVSDLGYGSPVYELVKEEIHHHLVCSNCRKTLPLEHDEISKFFNKISQIKEFAITTNHLVLFGICKDCQEVRT